MRGTPLSSPDVPLRFVDQLGTLPHEERRPGDAKWAVTEDGRVASLLFCCPCGCGDVSAVDVTPIAGRPCWSWNGDRERPTLSPSLLRTGGCGWHGWLDDGTFRSA